MECQSSLKSKIKMKMEEIKYHNLAVAVINLQKDVNIGGVIRTANAAALKEVIIVGRKKWNKSAATGAHWHIPIKRIRTSDEFLDYCKERGYNIVSLEIDKNAKNIFEYQYPENTILIVGNEGTGIPEKILKASLDVVYIPQYGNVECLNTATSAAIAIYDWIRKNGKLRAKKIIGHKYMGK